jgi:cation diffusion facilitator CzcD-associated flavoprotein CzcO
LAGGQRVCIIGAGPSGLAAARNCALFGLEHVVFEKNDKVGGNWVFDDRTGHSSVYENTHIISSRRMSGYEDFPMPDTWPDYPDHRLVQAYFESYARHFGLMPQIRFQHTVEHAEPTAAAAWDVRYTDAEGTPRHEMFDVLMVANGHHWDPRHPEYEGQFNGRYLHSHDFKRATDEWRGRNVLVIGAGNSACDVAVETSRIAAKVCLSMRGPQWFMPKFVFGKPSDVVAAGSAWMPAIVRQLGVAAMLRLLQGSYRQYGLPVNRRLPFSQHPTLNSELLDLIRHGRIQPRPAIRRLCGEAVEFVDGTREPFDVLCACTGFWISFPFFDKALIDFSDAERLPLYRKMMHARWRNLYFIGLFQPIGCIWPLADHQAKLACAEITGRYRRPADMERAIQREMERPHFGFERGGRHAAEVDYHRLRAELRAELKTAGIDIGRFRLPRAVSARRPPEPQHESLR